MAKVGKPPLIITDEMIEKAGELAARGLTQEQIASCLGMGERTLYEKFKQYPHFEQAVKSGKDRGIGEIANELFEKAKSGNVVAQIFYLKCRAGWYEENEFLNQIRKRMDELEKELGIDGKEKGCFKIGNKKNSGKGDQKV